MRDTLLSILGGLILLAAMAGGYLRWLRPRRGLDRQARGLLALVILTLMGGFVGAPFWWTDPATSFSWKLPPLAGRMLASAGSWSVPVRGGCGWCCCWWPCTWRRCLPPCSSSTWTASTSDG